jgi:hypothetical protein
MHSIGIRMRWACVALGAVVAAAPHSSWGAVSTVVGSATATAGSFGGRRVLCPDGAATVGGGVDLANVLTMRVTASGHVHDDGTPDGTRLLFQDDGPGPGPLGWQADGKNDASGSQTVKVAAICSTDISTTSVVNSASVSPGSFNTARVLCPEGTSTVGGGVDLGQVLLMTVTSSAPVYPDGTPDGTRLIFQPDGPGAAPIGWQASAINDDTGAQAIKVGAICSASVAVQTVVGSADVTPGNFDSVRVLCPEGTVAVSGGVDLNQVLTMRVTSSAPVYPDGTPSGTRLIFQPDGPGAAPIGWQASAVNDDGASQMMKVAAVCVPEPGAAGQVLAALGTLAGLGRARRRGQAWP